MVMIGRFFIEGIMSRMGALDYEFFFLLLLLSVFGSL